MKSLCRLYMYYLIWIIMTAAGLHITSDYLCAQQDILDENVIQKWKDYEAFSHSLQGTARVQRIRDGKPQESRFRFKQNRDCALSIYPHNRDPLLLLCSLANPRYAATLDLNKTDPTKVVLHNFTELPGDMGRVSPFELVFMETSRHFYYIGKSLRQAVSDLSFKVIKVTNETQDGQKLIRVDHTYNDKRRVANNDVQLQTHGSLWLDPSHYWCIRRSKLSTESTTSGERTTDTQVDVECETIDHPTGFPILKRVTEHVKVNQYKIKRETEGSSKIDYDLEVSDDVPDSEFTLSAFGLPEPASAEPVKRPIPMYVWILSAAGVCGGLALTFRYLTRRRRLTTTA